VRWGLKTTFYCCSVTKSHPTLGDPMDCNTPGFPVLHHLPELTQTHVHGLSDAIQPSHPLTPPFPPALNLSQHQGLPMSQLFTPVGSKYWSFRFSISPSNEYSGLISFRIEWFDVLAVQGTLKSLLQLQSSKASIIWYSALSIVQFSLFRTKSLDMRTQHPGSSAGSTHRAQWP